MSTAHNDDLRKQVQWADYETVGVAIYTLERLRRGRRPSRRSIYFAKWNHWTLRCGLTFCRSRQPPPFPFAGVAGDLLPLGLVGTLSPAAAAQQSVRLVSAGSQTEIPLGMA